MQPGPSFEMCGYYVAKTSISFGSDLFIKTMCAFIFSATMNSTKVFGKCQSKADTLLTVKEIEGMAKIESKVDLQAFQKFHELYQVPIHVL